ncbi:MAG: hypothetical protein ACLFR6_08230 [Salinarchaeum sp.]
MQRRAYLGTVAGSIAGVAAGATLLNTADSASASVAVGTLDVEGDDATTREDRVEDVRVSVDGTWEYDLPSGEDPAEWRAGLVTRKDGKESLVDQQEGTARYLQDSGDFEVSGSLFDSELWSPGDFVGAEGETAETVVPVGITFVVIDGDGKTLARAELDDETTNRVEHESYNASRHGSAGGEGAIVIET